MDKLTFRALRADEVDCRVSTVKENGLSLLLYKDARCDQNVLDETVGAMNWQRHHTRDNANCIVSIYDEDRKQWVEKEDTGTESFTEAEKGLASDSFKRACFNWGIGRELYTAPFIWIAAQNCTIKPKGNGFTCFDRFSVSEMEVSNGVITQLKITLKGKEVFGYGEKSGEPKIICEDCGNPIKPAKKRDGTIWAAQDVAAWSKSSTGKCLCVACEKKTRNEKAQALTFGEQNEPTK